MFERVRTLIVDDDPTILTLLDEVLRKDPSLVITTMSDSEEAFGRLGEDSFDLLITDLMMPKVDGLRLLARAKEVNSDMVVVIVTGYASLETTLEAIHKGVHDYITKPFRIEEFRLLVNNAAGHIRLIQENRRLAAENREMQTRLSALEKIHDHQQEELDRLRTEYNRRQELVAQSGAQAHENAPRHGVYAYGQGLQTTEERYDRELRSLEDLFSTGRLTRDEFEIARQRLKTKTMI